MRHALRIVALGLAVLVVLVVVGLIVLNGTYYGRERLRRLALDAVRDLVHGELIVDRIDGNLLDQFDLVNVSISDEAGEPFLVADRIRARLALAPLLSRRIVVQSLELERPVVTLAKAPGGPWNYQRIFPATDPVDTTAARGFGSWVDLRDVVIRDGTLLIHQPFPGDDAVRRQVLADAATDSALVQETRLRVERMNGSLRQVMEFRDINARIPRLVAAHPDSTAIAFRVGQLSMEATPLRAPDLMVRGLTGDVRVAEDSITMRAIDMRLPESRIEGNLTYHVSAGDVALDLRSDTLTLGDIQTLYPELPPEGGGRLELTATIRDTALSEYEFRNARLSIGASRVAGTLGVAVRPDYIELRNTDLRFTRFTTQLVERLVPGLALRIPGSWTGFARLDGPPDALRAHVDGTFDPDRHRPFSVTARGVIGTGTVTTTRDLRVTATAVPVSLAREFVAELPVEGTLNVDGVVSGSSASRFSGNARFSHHHSGASSTVVAEGTVAPSDNMRMQLHVQLVPLSMDLVERFASGLDLRGAVRGTGEVSGTPANFRAVLNLELPQGTLGADANITRASGGPGYRATVHLNGVDLRAVAPSMPETHLTGTATLIGTGTSSETVDAALTVRVRDAMIDSTAIPEAVLIATARQERLRVDTLRVRTPFAVATAAGDLGLTARTSGTLSWDVDLPRLSALGSWIATGDTTPVTPRPLVRQRVARAAARADSLRRMQADSASLAAVVARADVTRSQRARRAEIVPVPATPRDSLSGAVRATGTLTGNLQRFTLEGRAALDHIVWGGSEVGRGRIDVTWTDVRSPETLLTARADVDSIRVAGFAFDSTSITATHRDGAGDVDLTVFPGDTAQYRLRATYVVAPDQGEIRLQDVALRFDSEAWMSPRPSTVSWRGRGLTVDSLELRSDNGNRTGRILVHGEMPDRDPGRLEIRLDNVRVAPWLTLLQSDVPVDGMASLAATIEGTQRDPRITGTVALVRPTYRNAPFPDVRSSLRYATGRLAIDGDLRRAEGGGTLATFSGAVPVDLSLGEPVPTRRLAGELNVDIAGDSIPVGPLAQFTEHVSTLEGEMRGRIGLRGTWQQPRFDGGFTVRLSRLGLPAPGLTVTNAVARLRMAGDRLEIDTLVAYSEGPLHATGSVVLTDLARPVVDLRVVANETRILDNSSGRLVASARLAAQGPLDTLTVTGAVTIMHGLVRIPDPAQWNLINTGDPALFAVVDTALARELDLAPPSPVLENATVDVQLQVRRGTWARSREANIEVYGDLAIERRRGDQDLSVTGALHSDYGDYELYGRRFRVSRGSVRFTGPAANPVLQILATHEVRQAGRAPFDIQVTIGGSLEQPNISLQSDAQPTLNQSDLIAFLAFGQSSTALLQFEGSGLEGGGLTGSSLAGSVGALATRQLAGVALGALFAELESDLTERTAADVLRIRPAELPPGLSLGAVGTVARGTQIEIGKYLDRNTFLVGQIRPTLAVPGATLERRLGTQLRLRTSLETRYLPQTPSLTDGLRPRVHQVLGAVLFWTRGW